MTDTDQLLADTGAVRAVAARTPAVAHALASLGDHIECIPEPLRHRRPRAWAAVAVATAIAAVAVAVPTGAAASAFDWASARTGLFGRESDIENDASEFLDASDQGIRAVIERHTRHYTLPQGATWEPAYDSVLTDERVFVQERLVAAIVARTAVCAWEREWLEASTADAATRAHRAADVLASASSWPALVAEDPTGGLRRHLDGVARAAAKADEHLVRADVAMNCAVAR